MCNPILVIRSGACDGGRGLQVVAHNPVAGGLDTRNGVSTHDRQPTHAGHSSAVAGHTSFRGEALEEDPDDGHTSKAAAVEADL